MQHDPVTHVVNAILENGGKARKQGKEFKCQCPAHDDKTSSLQVGLGDKGAVLHCHAGCTPEAVAKALELPMGSLFNDFGQYDQPDQVPNLRAPVHGCLATYFYEDENGKVLFRVERRKDKNFVQATPDLVNPGEWNYTLGAVRRVPYRLPSVLAAAKEGEPVYVVEGEKDVHTLEGEGFVATCNPGGAGKFKREYAEYLTGANVVILPDNDKPGKEHAETICSFLRELARTVKVVELPDLPEKGDVTDWLKIKGNDAVRLREIVAEAEVKHSNRPQIFNAHDLMQENFPEIVMAVPGIIAEGLTFLVGAPKIGKSWMALGLGLEVASGGMALGTIPVQTGPVLYLALEDTDRRLQRRLSVMLGEQEAPAMLEFACRWPRLGAGGLDQLEEWLQAHGDARMVIIDTWAKVKSNVGNENSSMYDADYAAVTAVKNIADDYGTAVVFVHHQRKAQDADPLNTVAGSTGLTGAADAAVILTRPRGAEEGHLYVTGRDVEESRSIVSFEAETGRWLWLGEADDVEEQSTEKQVVQLLAQAMPLTLGPKEVAEALALKEGTAKWLLSKMATENKIMRVRRGQYTCANTVITPQVGPGMAAGPVAAVTPGVVHLPTTVPPIPGMPANLAGTGVPGGVLAVSEEEIEEALADDDGFGATDEEEGDDEGADE